ncbi:helix-turn-helix domain-containing protein [Gordonia sp. HY002]|uniref:PucR family transcriptional regulator n=1 Tax=Gordonia zhenghanii TaxID=2911516 RepID=UPI001EEFCC69|nr:helix-turn-helix domain-containing protein [Gordonia zhenghanii]MCF8569175.1 helix-turn-helix domain-containing protein [Gordonia zhenghanii]MCF8604577.1 helix-turn-helix domain-containing protein [Gordonia zhenghanii]
MSGPRREPVLAGGQAKALATSLQANASDLADAMLDYIVVRLPEVVIDDEIRGLTLGSCSSNIEAALSMVRHGIDVSAARAPVTALEHARAMAARGYSVDVILRFYRLGHEFFVEQLSEGLDAAGYGAAEALTVFFELERFLLRYIDRISSQIASEYIATLSRQQNEARIERADIVRELLADEPVDPARAERVLSHRLTGRHLALICWSDEPGRDLENVVQKTASALGAGRPLTVSEGPTTVWGWITVTGHVLPPATSTGRLNDHDSYVHIAFGSVHIGAAGFRTSHLEATRARRIAEIAERPAPATVHFRDVSLADALSYDLDAAQRFVKAELGDLTADGAPERDERATLLAVLNARGSLAKAAQALDIHRNTVLQRLRRAEKKVGRSSADRVAETHAALVLVDVLGRRALQNDW